MVLVSPLFKGPDNFVYPLHFAPDSCSFRPRGGGGMVNP